MKIFTLLTISGLIFCINPFLNAQESKTPWTFGIKAGINSSTYNLSTYDAGYTDGKIGFNGGLTVEYALRNGFFLSSGLEFTTKGTDKTDYYFNSCDKSFYSGRKEDSRRFKYLQLPLTIGHRHALSKDINLTLSVGGYFAYGLSGKGTHTTWSSEYDIDNGLIEESIIREHSKKNGDTDFGLIGGIGIEYKKFSFNVNYEHGLRDLFTAGSSFNSNDSWKNRSFTFSVGYKFK